MSRIVFVIGGARSGKSAFAEKMLDDMNASRKGYIATARVWDEEIKYRIYLHQKRRPENWRTFEYPNTDFRPLKAILQESDVFLFDCVTMYINNLLMDRTDITLIEENLFPESALHDLMKEVENKIKEILLFLQRTDKTIIFVSNELGMGIVPNNPMSRIYRDLVGTVNQLIASAANEVYWVACGIPICLKRGDKYGQDINVSRD